MKESTELPKTFCPSPENFCKEYQCEEDKIIVIALSSKLSGTYNSASLARDLYLSEHKEKDIRVIDSMTGSIGAGLLLIMTTSWSSSGHGTLSATRSALSSCGKNGSTTPDSERIPATPRRLSISATSSGDTTCTPSTWCRPPVRMRRTSRSFRILSAGWKNAF